MIKAYPRLYKRDSRSKIRVWWMDQEGGKYRANHGLEDGAIVTSGWTTTEAKNTGKVNSTSSEQQATREILAEYKNQQKHGYFDKISDIDNAKFEEPMRAQKYKDRIAKVNLTTGEWGGQIKFNGCLHGDTQITLADGATMCIRDIVDKQLQVNLKTYNTKTQQIEVQPVCGHLLNKVINDKTPFQWYVLDFEDGSSIKLTGNHRIWVENIQCWRRVEDLVGDETVLPLNLL